MSLFGPEPPDRIAIRVDGRPQPWERAAPVRGRMHNTADHRHYLERLRGHLRHAWQLAGLGDPWVGPVSLNVVAVFERPASVPGSDWSYAHHEKQDRDNLLKIVQDAANGIVYRDDRQVCTGAAIKVWAPPRWAWPVPHEPGYLVALFRRLELLGGVKLPPNVEPLVMEAARR